MDKYNSKNWENTQKAAYSLQGVKKMFANFLKEFLIIKENLNENQTEIPTSKFFFLNTKPLVCPSLVRSTKIFDQKLHEEDAQQ